MRTPIPMTIASCGPDEAGSSYAMVVERLTGSVCLESAIRRVHQAASSFPCVFQESAPSYMDVFGEDERRHRELGYGILILPKAGFWQAIAVELWECTINQSTFFLQIGFLFTGYA